MKHIYCYWLLFAAMLFFNVVGVALCLHSFLWSVALMILPLNCIALFFAVSTIWKQKKKIDALSCAQNQAFGLNEHSLQEKLSEKRLQLRLLQNQINPHFLYNTLDSIRGQALIYQQPEIADITERLSRYFRYCISRDEHVVPLRKEIKNVQDYFYIQKYRFGDKIDMNIAIENDDVLDYLIPKTVLQPLVENAILHGLEPISGNGSITIHVKESQARIYITISDTGAGIPLPRLQELNDSLNRGCENTAQSKSCVSIGIFNVNERIRLCFGEEYGLHFRSVLHAGTDVELVIPKIRDIQWISFDQKLRGSLDVAPQ